MKVKELITELKKWPENCYIRIYDPRSSHSLAISKIEKSNMGFPLIHPTLKDPYDESQGGDKGPAEIEGGLLEEVEIIPEIIEFL